MKFGDREIGPGLPAYVIGEVGLNHNGHVEFAKLLADIAKAFGFDSVKFQKRTIEAVYSDDVLCRPREGPFGVTYGDEKYGLELSKSQYDIIDAHCKKIGIDWSASCWDDLSVRFIARYNPPYLKVPSPCVHNLDLVKAFRDTGIPLIVSTGLCDLEDVDRIMGAVDPSNTVLMHCVSGYPTPVEHANIAAVKTLADRYGCRVGYSGHEYGVSPTHLAVAYGACVIERHITIWHGMYGSDHAASIEPAGMEKLVKNIRAAEQAVGDGVKRIMPCEDMGKRANLKG